MNEEIAAQLAPFNLDADCFGWEQLDSSWQAKVQRATDSLPSHLLIPRTTEALSQIMQYAYERGWSVLPCGSGSKLDWGGRIKPCQIVISTQHLNRVIEQATDDLTLTVEAGTKLADLQVLLQQFGQFLPIDPAFPESATIGGIVATADTGSWRQRYGGIRDLVLGLSFVRADGAIAKAGGRVVKNVAGYDLMKLFTGSFGTLGIISQVTFRTYPWPEAAATAVILGQAQLIQALSQTLRNSGLTPTAADLLTPAWAERLGLEKSFALAVRFQSIPESVTEQIHCLQTWARSLDLSTQVFQAATEAEFWQSQGSLPSIAPIICKIGVLPSAAIATLRTWELLTAGAGWGLIHIGSGLGKLACSGENGEILQKMRETCQQHQGFLTVLTGPPSLKQQIDPWGYSGNALELMRQLKNKFDPQGILHPGCFVGGI